VGREPEDGHARLAPLDLGEQRAVVPPRRGQVEEDEVGGGRELALQILGGAGEDDRRSGEPRRLPDPGDEEKILDDADDPNRPAPRLRS
jgi:hypothetical protein